MGKKFSFPTAYTVMLIVMLFVMGLVMIIPSGKFAKLQYSSTDSVFVVSLPNGETKEYEATQKVLDDLGVKVDLVQFTNGTISKPVAIPKTYERLEKEPISIQKAIITFLKAPIQGLYNTIDIVAFLLVIGGIIGVLNSTDTFNAGMAALSRSLKGNEKLMIVIVLFLTTLGGSTFGLAEETIAFYPILVPIFMAAGYDAMVALAAVYIGSSIGTMISTVNPFSVVIASNIAGIPFTTGMPLRLFAIAVSFIVTCIFLIRYAESIKKDPSKSIIYSQKAELEAKFLNKQDQKEEVAFTFSKKIMVGIFGFGFVIMVYGVKELGWWFQEMTALFFGITFLLFFIARQKEKEFVGAFVAGASDLLCVALIIALSRAVTIIMDGGLISDTILYTLSGLVSQMNGVFFSAVMFFVYSILGFFIQSSSGLAVLSMPIMTPLADVVGIGRDIIITSYTFGQGIVSYITPTGLILATLAMVDVTYDKWLKFIMPLFLIQICINIIILCVGSLF